MARDHTRVNLGIWGDDDFSDLPIIAQNLFFRLWTSPGRSYCGAHEWHPGKIAQSAADWTPDLVEMAGQILSEADGRFLIIETATAECLLRSWIKHDGLCRQPNMAVSMANDRAKLASRTLRGVVVHEVAKIRKREPKLGAWDREQVVEMLSQKSIDAFDLEPYQAPITTALTPLLTPVPTLGLTPPPTPDLTPAPRVNGGVGVNPGPTTATATTTATEGGYVSRERHQSGAADSNDPPPRFCARHLPDGGDRTKPCRDCGDANARRTHWLEDRADARRREIADCTGCDEKGWAIHEDGTPVEPAQRCIAHDWEHAHA